MLNGRILAGGILLFWLITWWIVAEITEYLDDKQWEKTKNWDDKK